MEYNSLKDIQIALLSGKTTTEKLVIFYLNNIESVRDLNAYIEVYQEEALSKAKELDQKIKHHPDTLGKLFGCIISVKDLIVYKNHKVNAGSGILDGFESQFSATAIEAVLKEDAIIIGRTNCDEFGMGSANTNSHFGSVKNAVDPEKYQVVQVAAQLFLCKLILVWLLWVQIPVGQYDSPHLCAVCMDSSRDMVWCPDMG